MKAKRVITGLTVLLILLGTLAWKGENVAAQAPERKTTIVVAYNEYEYWMIRWEDNQILCRILSEHEGLPSSEEILAFCGRELHAVWLNTPPCLISQGEGTTDCEGVYLYLVSFQPKEREVPVELPPPVVWVDLEGCTPVPPENRCDVIPILLLTGEEPLPNEQITAIHGTYDDEPFTCEGEICRLQLRSTPLAGSTIEFWADSSYGDSSERFTAQVRVIDTGVTAAPGAGGWYVDVISTQWRGAPIASCARIWEAFPPLGAPPAWLATPEQSALLASDAPYFYLAGRLISQGLVDASECPTGGMLPNGYADACGLEKARPLVAAWQNQFDTRIVEVARETGVPGQLMKNLFAQESQFWPGVFRVPYEFGLGQITDNGADVILLWNKSFFQQFCPLVLAEDACLGGYLRLRAEDQAMLRGALALQAKADCPECPEGIDLSNVHFSVSLFASTLQANCAQVSRTVFTATEQMAGTVSSYEDLWRFTIANYHAGSGCLAYAIHTTWQSTGMLTWQQVSTSFTEACRGVVPYVEKITR